MRRYLIYFWYIMVHKFWVMVEGRKMGLSWWRLFLHDYTKFYLFSEFIPYARYFYNPDGSERDHDKNPRTGKEINDFRDAWKHHYTHNKHHWNHWSHLGDITKEMNKEDAAEMIADWRAMGRVKGNSAEEYYHENYYSIDLHPVTRQYVDIVLGRPIL